MLAFRLTSVKQAEHFGNDFPSNKGWVFIALGVDEPDGSILAFGAWTPPSRLRQRAPGMVKAVTWAREPARSAQRKKSA